MIKAIIRPENPEANLRSYHQAYKNFSWSQIEDEFPEIRTGLTNIVHYAIDRWAAAPDNGEKTALIFEQAGRTIRYSYSDLAAESCKWANLLQRHGFKKGDRLFIFLPPCPEIYFAMLGCARMGVIFSILYPTMAFEEVTWRLLDAQPLAVLTTEDLVEKLSSEGMKGVSCVFIVSGEPPGLFPWEVVTDQVLERMPQTFETQRLSPGTPLYLLYSSGSTGPPKGVVHAHHDMVGHLMTGRSVLDLVPESILWTDGDPAWVTGTVYGAFAPWLCRCTSVVQGDSFSASTWYRTLGTYRVSTWYTTPMTLRKLAAAGADLPGRYDFSSLKHIATVGETLVPEIFYWVRENLKHTPHDTWWMTETGMICIANFASEPTKPGSMGRPVPGVQAAVVDESGKPFQPFTLGQLALKAGWPAMMKSIWRNKDRYNRYFLNDWFLTGDMVIVDEDGYFYHQGRNDDLIKAGREFIGPYEIESVLRMHPAVAEAAVISKGAVGGPATVKAFLTLKERFTASSRLNQELYAFVKTNLHSEVTVTDIAFMTELPKTRSGKLVRRALRAQELGLPSGDPLNLRD